MGTKIGKEPSMGDRRFALQLVVSDQEVIAELMKVPEVEVNDYALRALRLGVLSLRSARGEVDATAVKEQLTTAMGQLQVQLVDFVGKLDNQLSKYSSANVNVNELDRQKVTAILQTYQGTLVAEMDRAIKGAAGPLLKAMDPNARDGAVGVMGDTVQKALNLMADRIKNEVLVQFSRDSSGSAMSKMEDTIRKSHEVLIRQFSMDDPNSALRRLHESIGQRVESLAKSQSEFQSEVREEFAGMKAKKEAEAASTTHGKVYEEALGDVLGAIVRRHGHTLDSTGLSTGLIRSCKVGDYVARLNDDSAAPGALIVVEAKSAGGYDTQKILAECEMARKNRGAQVAIFVMDPQYASASTPTLGRLGETIIVQWSPDNAPGTQANEVGLLAAFSLAAALCVKAARGVQAAEVDYGKMEKAVLDIQKRIEQLTEVSTWATTISGSAAKILDRMRISTEALTTQAEVLMDQIRGMKGAE